MLSISTFTENTEPDFIKIEASLSNGSRYCAACVNELVSNIEMECLSGGTKAEEISTLPLYKPIYAVCMIYHI